MLGEREKRARVWERCRFREGKIRKGEVCAGGLEAAWEEAMVGIGEQGREKRLEK